jgi:hypothetical protein
VCLLCNGLAVVNHDAYLCSLLKSARLRWFLLTEQDALLQYMAMFTWQHKYLYSIHVQCFVSLTRVSGLKDVAGGCCRGPTHNGSGFRCIILNGVGQDHLKVHVPYCMCLLCKEVWRGLCLGWSEGPAFCFTLGSGFDCRVPLDSVQTPLVLL